MNGSIATKLFENFHSQLYCIHCTLFILRSEFIQFEILLNVLCHQILYWFKSFEFACSLLNVGVTNCRVSDINEKLSTLYKNTDIYFIELKTKTSQTRIIILMWLNDMWDCHITWVTTLPPLSGSDKNKFNEDQETCQMNKQCCFSNSCFRRDMQCILLVLLIYPEDRNKLVVREQVLSAMSRRLVILREKASWALAFL